MDTLHTNEERIEKIRCLLDTVAATSGELRYVVGGETILIDLASARDCLAAIEQFMGDHNTLDCI